MSQTFVLHMDDVTVSDRIDLQLIEIAPNKPYRFDDEFICEKFMEHKWYHGFVKVEQEFNDETGAFKLNLEKARAESKLRLENADDQMVQQYVRTQMEDRVAIGRPPLPPVGRVADIITRRKVDLAGTYGIHPVGWKGQTAPVTAMTATHEALIQQQADLIAKMAVQLENTTKRLTALEKAVS